MHYLIVAIVANTIGTVTAAITDAIEHLRWVSALVGLAAGAVAFALGATKTSLDIIDKRLDIRKKKRDERSQMPKLSPLRKSRSRPMAGLSIGKSRGKHTK
jgi:hypothetical protein